jgi:hypothetical protein
MKLKDREAFVSMASAKKLPVQTHFVSAPQIRRDRVVSRNLSKGETFSSEITPAIFEFMEAQFEAPTDEELSKSIVIAVNDRLLRLIPV